MINVTKSFLPPIEEYIQHLRGIWERGHLTNHGPLVNELEEKLKNYLGVRHCFFVNNGTTALQIAIRALELDAEVITTPFSYVATTSSLVWERCTPVFVDIDPRDFNIDVKKIEAKITARTQAILATHVYGIPCQVDELKVIAKKHNLKVIYDAAHAFGVNFKKSSILTYGDISTLSFHATKLFHTVEGGAIITNDDDTAHRIGYMRNFGHKGQEDFWGIGINGKNSELHAAMGLSVYPYLSEIIESRKLLSETYDRCFRELGMKLQRPELNAETAYNFAYYPVVFENEKQLLVVRDSLNAAYIYPRRYFYPTLNKLPYLEQGSSLPEAESISSRVLCLPLFHDLAAENIRRICTIIAEVLRFR